MSVCVCIFFPFFFPDSKEYKEFPSWPTWHQLRLVRSQTPASPPRPWRRPHRGVSLFHRVSASGTKSHIWIPSSAGGHNCCCCWIYSESPCDQKERQRSGQRKKKERRGVRGGGREKQLRKGENKNKTKKGQKSQTKSGRSRENAGTKFAFFKRYPDVEPTTGTMRHKGRVQTEGDLSSLSLTSSVGLFIT